MRIKANVSLNGPFGSIPVNTPFDPGDDRIGNALIQAGIAVLVDPPVSQPKEEIPIEETAELPESPEKTIFRRGKQRR